MVRGFADIDHRKDAVIQCVKLLGLKKPEDIVEDGNGVYSHTSTKGRKKYFIPFLTYNQYNKNRDKYPSAKFHRCIGYYVLYWNLDESNLNEVNK